MATATTNKFHPENRLNRKDAAAYLGLSVNTLTCWGSIGRGPKFYKPGKCCFYLKTELDDYIEARSCSNSEQLTA